MKNEELINGLRWCADESICGEKCPYFDEKKDFCSVEEILNDAADALEAAEKRIVALEAEVERLKASNEELREKQTYIDHWGDKWMTSAKDVPTMAYNHGFFDGEQSKVQDKVQDIEIIQCKDCKYYMNDAKNCWNEMINADMIIEPDWFCANAVRKDYDDFRN